MKIRLLWAGGLAALISFVLVLAWSNDCAGQDAKRKDVGNPSSGPGLELEGTWKVETIEQLVPLNAISGSPIPQEAKTSVWVISKDQIQVRVKKETRTMKYSLSGKGKIRNIDLTPCQIPFPDDGTSKGTYRISDNTLVVCFGIPEMKRPAGFASEKDNFYFLFTLKRVSKKTNSK